MHTPLALDLFAGSRQQILELLEAVPDERWAEQPAGVRNHPAWTMPHLCVGIDFGLHLLGKQGVCPDESWLKTTGGGTMPTTDRTAYPSREVALDTYARAHETFTTEVKAAPASVFDQEMPNPDYRSFFPTIGHALGYFLTQHEPHHLGQLAVWKRAAGLAGD